jgi:hypothetical protein
MQAQTTEHGPLSSWAAVGRKGQACLIALVLLGSLFLPVVPIVVGVFLVAAVVVHVSLPELQPYVQPVLRVPVERTERRVRRLLLFAGGGLLLVVVGASGAKIRGHVLGTWTERGRQQEFAEQSESELLDRARARLAAGDVAGAELVLIDAEGIDGGKADEVDELLERIRRSDDAKAILDVLVRLSRKDFDALEKGEAVPEDLDLGERALTYRAVELASEQMDEARRLRAAR